MSWRDWSQFLSSHDLCLTGEGLTHLLTEHPRITKRLLPHIRVFARVNPKQKEAVVTTLKALGYTTQWLSRALLLCAMHRDGVQALRNPDGVTPAAFARAFPDSEAWFRKLEVRGQCSILQDFFSNLEYAGRPEFFSMFACLLGNAALRVRPAWLLKHCLALRRKMLACYSLHGLMAVPARCVRALVEENSEPGRLGD